MRYLCIATLLVGAACGHVEAHALVITNGPAVRHVIARDAARHEEHFVLTNTTRRRIDIQRVESSCGCAKTSLSAMTVAPGESADLVIAVEPRVTDGTTTAVATVWLAGVQEPLRATVSLGADARVSMRPIPMSLDFGTIDDGAVARQVTLVCPAEAPVDHIEVSAGAPWFRMTQSERSSPGEHVCRVEVVPPVPPGPWSGYLYLCGVGPSATKNAFARLRVSTYGEAPLKVLTHHATFDGTSRATVVAMCRELPHWEWHAISGSVSVESRSTGTSTCEFTLTAHGTDAAGVLRLFPPAGSYLVAYEATCAPCVAVDWSGSTVALR